MTVTAKDFLGQQEIAFKPYPPMRLFGGNSGRDEVFRYNLGTLLVDAPHVASELVNWYETADVDERANILGIAVELFLLDCKLTDEDTGEVIIDDDRMLYAIRNGDPVAARERAKEIVAKNWPDVLSVWERLVL